MKLLLLAAAASLALTGCQTATVDQAIQQNLPQVCSAAATAHMAFVAVAPLAEVSQRTMSREAAAWAALEPLCGDPDSATTASVLVAAAAAYATITVALRAADSG